MAKILNDFLFLIIFYSQSISALSSVTFNYIKR